MYISYKYQKLHIHLFYYNLLIRTLQLLKFKRTKIYINIPHFVGSPSELSWSSLHSDTPVAENFSEGGPNATAAVFALLVEVEGVTILVAFLFLTSASRNNFNKICLLYSIVKGYASKCYILWPLTCTC